MKRGYYGVWSKFYGGSYACPPIVFRFESKSERDEWCLVDTLEREPIRRKDAAAAFGEYRDIDTDAVHRF